MANSSFRYFMSRLLMTIPVIFIVTVLIFLARVAVPGDPIAIMFQGQEPPQEIVDKIRSDWGLDQPVYIQYLNWAGNALQGDLGDSYRTRQPVIDQIADRYVNTLVLAVSGLAIGAVIGMVTGVIAAVKQNTFFDIGSMIIAMIGVAMPSFWLALLLSSWFSVRWQIFPSFGSGTWQHVVLPATTLGLLSSAIIARLVRSSMLEVLRQDYVRTARAKGLKEQAVIMGHAFRNSLIPVVTTMGLQFGSLLGGAFITETVFSYQGLGYLGVQALQSRDFPLIQGVLLVVALTYILVTLAVDAIYAFLDPRISLS